MAFGFDPVDSEPAPEGVGGIGSSPSYLYVYIITHFPKFVKSYFDKIGR